MAISLLPAAVRGALQRRRPLLRYAIAWTGLLTTTVAVASFAPELAFVWAVSPASPLTRACGGGGEAGAVGVPSVGPAWQAVCVPPARFGQTVVDFFVPPMFAALVVGGSACVVRAVGLWEAEEDAVS